MRSFHFVLPLYDPQFRNSAKMIFRRMGWVCPFYYLFSLIFSLSEDFEGKGTIIKHDSAPPPLYSLVFVKFSLLNKSY